MNVEDEIQKDIFIELYREHGLWSRHQESQRAVVSNFIITLSAALIGFVVFDKAINTADVPITLFIAFVGLFGAIFSYKYYERFNFHDSRIDAYKNILDKLIGDEVDIFTIEQEADKRTKERFSVISKRGLYTFWITFHSIIFLSGLLLTVIACNGYKIIEKI